MEQPILEARDLVKEYISGSRPLRVLNKVNISVQPGVILTVVGSSGAGKSTLLHILGALDRPTEGEVQYKGENLYGISDRARARIRNRDFGFVFQFYHLMPELTALENVLMPGLVGRTRGKEERAWARELLAAVGLTDRMHHFPSQLSGGEQQRVAIARALMNKPRILFADEPTGNLDSANSRSIIEMLLDLQESYGFALVMVTHNYDLAHYGARQMKLKDGMLQGDDRKPGGMQSM
jgi:lipoprotein-releasing system ATP-binding protein